MLLFIGRYGLVNIYSTQEGDLGNKITMRGFVVSCSGVVGGPCGVWKRDFSDSSKICYLRCKKDNRLT